MQAKLVAFWNTISTLGIHADLSSREVRVVKFLNRFCVISIGILVLNLAAFYTTDYFTPILKIGGVIIFINALVLTLNSHHLSQFGRVVYAIFLPILMLGSSIVTKIMMDTPITLEEYIVPRMNLTIALVFVFVVLDGPKNKLLLFAVLFFNLSLIVAYDTLHELFGVGINTSPNINYDAQLVNSTNILSAFLILILLSFLFHVINKYEANNLDLVNELEHSNSQLETLIHEKNNALRLTNTELIDRIERIDRFTHLISHNLREPITSLKGLLLLDKEQKDLEKTTEYMDAIVNRILYVTEDLISILNIENLDYDGSSELVDLVELLDGIKAEASSRFPDHDFSISYSGLSTINTNKNKLRIVLENLIGNSIKFKKEHIALTISIEQTGNRVKLSDNGIGIDLVKNGGKIFKPFMKFHHSEGIGLGLFYAHLLMKQMGSMIEVESELDEGTTFTLFF